MYYACDMGRIYLDYASATPVHPKAASAAYAASEDFFGNPSASHEEGRKARAALDEARSQIARSLSVKPDELVFTSGGTEANNIAIQGIVEALHGRGIPFASMHIVTSETEHASVLEAAEILERRGVSVTYLKPSFDGLIAPEEVVEALKPETVLVTFAHVNSETGVVLPIAEISRHIARWKERGVSSFRKTVSEFSFPALHADAAQSPLYLDASPHALLADLVSYDAQKILGPKGFGALYRDFSIPLSPVSGGGTQERGIRPGTENVAAAAGSAVAFELAHDARSKREERVRELRDLLIERVLKEIPEAKLVGHPKRRIANNAFFALPGVDGDYLAVLMDKEGIAISPRSACAGSGGGFSHVAYALTGDKELSRGTIRFSLGPDTGEREISEAVRALKRVLPFAQGRA